MPGIARRQRRRFVRLIGFALALGVASPAWAQQALLVLRHAEQTQGGGGMMDGDPALNEAGQRRAAALAAHLKDAGITAIYTSQFLRARQTAEPVAAALKLEPAIVLKDDVAALADAIKAKHGRDTVLVVGHSDTVPAILKAFGATAPVEIGKTEFDSLWLVVPRPGEKALVSRLRL